MNYTKLQTEILKLAAKGKTYNWFATETEEKVVLSNGYILYVIPKCYWLLNTKMLGMKVMGDRMLQTLLEVPDEEVFYHGNVKEFDKHLLFMLEGHDYNTYVNSDLLKLVGPIEDYQLRNKGPKCIVYLLNEEEQLVSLVLPVNVR